MPGRRIRPAIGASWTMANALIPGISRRLGRNEQTAAEEVSSSAGVLLVVRYPPGYSRLAIATTAWAAVGVFLDDELADRFTSGWSGPTWCARDAGRATLSVRRTTDGSTVLTTPIEVRSGGPTVVVVIPEIRVGMGFRSTRPPRVEVRA